MKEAKYSQQEIHSEVLPHSSHDDDDDSDDDNDDDVILLSLSLFNHSFIVSYCNVKMHTNRQGMVCS